MRHTQRTTIPLKLKLHYAAMTLQRMYGSLMTPVIYQALQTPTWQIQQNWCTQRPRLYAGLQWSLKLLGLRLRPERVQQSNAAKDLTEAYLGVPYTDWTRRQPDWQRKPKPSQDAEMK